MVIQTLRSLKYNKEDNNVTYKLTNININYECNLLHSLILTTMKTINYTTRTFYVPAEKIEVLHKFQEKCREQGHKSYSSVMLNLMENYINGD